MTAERLTEAGSMYAHEAKECFEISYCIEWTTKGFKKVA
jgi:hypothetical protein